jgi:hypothetical protein
MVDADRTSDGPVYQGVSTRRTCQVDRRGRRRKNPRQRKAMAVRGYQTYGLQRLGTLADIWPGVGL